MAPTQEIAELQKFQNFMTTANLRGAKVVVKF
jgi:hypothetical protein